MSEEKPRFFLAYFSGELGTTIGIFVLHGDTFIGADLGGGTYSGNLQADAKHTQLTGHIRFKSKGRMTNITGASSDFPVDIEQEVSLKLPLDSIPYHQIMSPTGPINVRFEEVVSQ